MEAIRQYPPAFFGFNLLQVLVGMSVAHWLTMSGLIVAAHRLEFPPRVRNVFRLMRNLSVVLILPAAYLLSYSQPVPHFLGVWLLFGVQTPATIGYHAASLGKHALRASPA